MILSIPDMYNGFKESVVTAKENFDFVINTTSDIFNFFKTLFTDPMNVLGGLFEKIGNVAPDMIIIVLVALIILKFLGFENLNKYVALTLVTALLIALI